MTDSSIYYLLADSYEIDALHEAFFSIAPHYSEPRELLVPISLCNIIRRHDDDYSSIEMIDEVLHWCDDHISYKLETRLHEFIFSDLSKIWGMYPFHYFFNFQIICFAKASDWLAFKLRWL